MSTMFQRHQKSEELIELLGGMQKGQMLTYKALSAEVGIDIQRGKGRGYLDTARRFLLKNRNVLFATIRGTGLLCCDERGVVDVGAQYVHRTGRIASIGHKKMELGVEDPHNISPANKHKYYATRTVLSLFRRGQDSKLLKAAEVAQEFHNSDEMPTEATLDLFREE